MAVEQGADGVELDVRTCGSGEVVVSHDAHLGRVAGRAAWIAMLPWERIREVRIGETERVPLLDEVIDLVVGAGLRLNVEVKGDVPDRPATVRAVAAAIARRRSAERDAILLSTFDPVVLANLRRHVRGVPLALLFDHEHTGRIRARLLAGALRPDGLHPHEAICTPRRVRRWRARGLFVNPWTVNDPQRARWLTSLGVTGLISDDVPALRAGIGA